MYTIKPDTEDEVWPDSFLYCIEILCEEHSLSAPDHRAFEIQRFALDAIRALRTSRDYNDERVIKILDAYKGHMQYSKARLLHDYKNLEQKLAEIEPERKNRDFGGYAVSVVIMISIILFLMAVIFGS